MANIILETPRLILREFVPEDLAGLYRLYEESDTRYIDPLSKDPDEELIVLKNYIHYIEVSMNKHRFCIFLWQFIEKFG